MNPSVLIPILGIMIPIIVVPTVLGLKFAREVRAMEHAERMKALELGRTLPKDEAWWSPARICVTIGAVVPVASLAIAWMACESLGYREEVWILSGSVGITGVVSGSLLAGKHFNQRARLESAVGSHLGNGKPAAFDPDAFDVAGRRG